MKNRTLRVAIGSTLSEEKQIENRVVQGAVLSFTPFLVAMAEITHGIEESIKIIGYADDWIIHTTHKHERVSVVKLKSHGQNRQMRRGHRLSNLN
jgi:glutamine synthetase